MDRELLKPARSPEEEPVFEESITAEQKRFLVEDCRLLYESLILRAKFSLDEKPGDVGYVAYDRKDNELEDLQSRKVTDVLIWVNLEDGIQLQITRGVQEEYCLEQGDWTIGLIMPSEREDYDSYHYSIALWESGHTEIQADHTNEGETEEEELFETVIPSRRDFDRLRAVVVQVLASMGES